MSLLNELNRRDQTQALVAVLNKRNKQVESLIAQKDSLTNDLANAKLEIESLKEQLKKAKPYKRTSTKKTFTKSKVTEPKQETVADDDSK
jgi:hypothetical protein